MFNQLKLPAVETTYIEVLNADQFDKYQSPVDQQVQIFIHRRNESERILWFSSHIKSKHSTCCNLLKRSWSFSEIYSIKSLGLSSYLQKTTA